MINDNYLQYIRILYDRISNRSKRAGFNTWALLIGIIYLVWNSIPLLNTLKNDSNVFAITLTYYSHIHISILSFIFLFFSHPKSPSRPLDYRIKNYTTISNFGDILKISITCFLILIFPIYATHLVLHSTRSLSTFYIYQLTINKWFFIITTVIIFCLITIESVYQKFKGYPCPVFNLPAKKPKLTKSAILTNIIISLLLLIIIELPLGNLFSLINIYFQTQNTNLAEVITFAFNLSLICFALVTLIYIHNTQESLHNLERLERDIIIHKIDESEIKMRLQEEFLGHEIGEWLTNELKDLKSKAETAIEFFKKEEHFYTDEYINSITKKIEESIVNLKDKNRKIIEEKAKEFFKIDMKIFFTEAEKVFDNYYNKYMSLFHWLDFALLSFQDRDPYLKEILSNTLKDLSDIKNDISTQMHNTKEKLKLKQASFFTSKDPPAEQVALGLPL